MRTEEEVLALTLEYENRLAAAVARRETHPLLNEDSELLILSLVDKLEVLFWLLQKDLPCASAAEAAAKLYH